MLTDAANSGEDFDAETMVAQVDTRSPQAPAHPVSAR
jgi:hypothetical protein